MHPEYLNLPQDLQHLIEKREGNDRRESDIDSTADEDAAAELDRRQNERRAQAEEAGLE